jgi:hypothetical protein
MVSFKEIHWKWVHNNLKMLRVLHLELYARFVPEEIGTLIHLRYLKILRAYGIKIPDSIGNLKNLETLAITRYGGDDEDAAVLPGSIIKLTSLRNLLGNVSYLIISPWSQLGRASKSFPLIQGAAHHKLCISLSRASFLI